MATSTNTPEQGSQQQEVVVWLFGSHCQLHGPVDYSVQVWLKQVNNNLGVQILIHEMGSYDILLLAAIDY